MSLLDDRSRAAVGLLLVLLGGPAQADAPDALPPRWLLTFGLQGPLQPQGGLTLGVLARADLLFEQAPTTLVVHAAWKTVSLELGAGPNLVALGGFFAFRLQLIVEPGFYLAVREGATLEDGRRLDPLADRAPGFRYGALAAWNLNYRKGRLWLYSRETAWAKRRLVPEYDSLSDAVLDGELGLELANAVFVDVLPKGRRRLWLYGEYTHQLVSGNGTVVARPSVGFIVEDLWRGVTVDLDLSYGLREGPLRGFGAILVMWISPPLRGPTAP